MSKTHIATLSFVLVSGIVLAGCQNQAAVKKEPETTTVMQAPPAATAQPSLAVAVDSKASKVASVETSYQSPAGEEKVGFKLTVDTDGVITEVQTEILAKAPISVMRQTKFAEELPTALKGKKLSELQNIDRVGGSSLTTGAFNKALAQLKAAI